MNAPVGFELLGERGLLRPVGMISFDEAVELVSAAITAARQSQARDLLINSTALAGFPSPDTFQRFFAATEWALRGSGLVRVAIVARAEFIDPQKFGVTVALNRGLACDVFTSEAEAIAWLDAMRSAEQRG